VLATAKGTNSMSVYDMDWTTIGVALFGFLGVFFGAFFSYLSQKQGRANKIIVDEINDAVNNRHNKGENALKLYDLAWENHKRVDNLTSTCDDLSLRVTNIEESCCGTNDNNNSNT